MFRGKKTLVATGATVLVAAASLAFVPLVASAAGTSPTSTTVVSHPAATTTGHAITLVAQVTSVTPDATTMRHAPRSATGNSTVPTGSVTFTITGHNASTVNCKTGNTIPINHGGKAVCKVTKGQLQAEDSPYSVTALYGGDATFAPSPGTTSVTVTKAKTKTKLHMGPSRPVSGSPNAVTATVKTRGGESLLTGTVTFAVASSPATGKTVCTNDNGSGRKATYDSQPLAVSGNVATAVCDLQPGWFIISKAGPGNKHPHGSWNVSATYSGDGNFQPSTGKKGGHSHS